MRYLVFLTGIFIVAGCAGTRKTTGESSGAIHTIRFVNEYVIPNGLAFKNTIIGGLSGIDYDAGRDLYYMISDDPGSKGPARYYTARIRIGVGGIDSVEIVDMTPLLNSQGQIFANITIDRVHSADVEAMRYDRTRDELVWTSEGQRVVGAEKNELQDPSIAFMSREGRFKDSMALPANMHVQAVAAGPRHNSVFEGASFDDSDRYLYISVEDALYEDGPRAGLGMDSTAWIRILKFDRDQKKQVAQYAYRVDPVPYPAVPPGAFKINGVSDILYVGNEQLLVIERAFSVGRSQSDIRVYLADLAKAGDISSVASLQATPPQKPIEKKLLLDMDKLERFIDNVEGVTFGPLLPNGHRSLVFVVDDNFDKRQKNQFLLFEVLN